MTPFNDKNVDDHSLKTNQKKLSKQSLIKLKYVLLCILILSINRLAFLISLIIYHTHRFQNDLKLKEKEISEEKMKNNQVIRLRFTANQTIHYCSEKLQQSIDEQKKLNETIEELTNQLNRNAASTVKTNGKNVANTQEMYQQSFHRHQLKSNLSWRLIAETIAGENGQEEKLNKLNEPYGIYVDQNNKSLIIYDWKHEVKRWRKSEKEGTIVAGGNGRENQLDHPTFLFIDRQETVYVSDNYNHRVMKWLKGAKKGIVVAGGYEKGDSSKQLSYPQELIVNEVGDVYVADAHNHRIMCWPSRSKEDHRVLGGVHDSEEGSDLFFFIQEVNRLMAKIIFMLSIDSLIAFDDLMFMKIEIKIFWFTQ